jgi:hypothetical protein
MKSIKINIKYMRTEDLETPRFDPETQRSIDKGENSGPMDIAQDRDSEKRASIMDKLKNFGLSEGAITGARITSNGFENNGVWSVVIDGNEITAVPTEPTEDEGHNIFLNKMIVNNFGYSRKLFNTLTSIYDLQNTGESPDSLNERLGKGFEDGKVEATMRKLFGGIV